ncbi:MAG TPA: hypothetical protein PLZ86_10315, partial [bacterium]|nr:hypothetical protein [bacterium]
MTREELYALRRQNKWERLCRLQSKVMPIVYGMGESFVVNEIDIRPDDGLVYVFGEFCDCEAWIRLERPMCGGPVVPWLELKIMDNPEEVPDSCPAPLKELEEEAGVELFFRRAWLSLGTEARDCADSAALKIIFEHLLVTAARA